MRKIFLNYIIILCGAFIFMGFKKPSYNIIEKQIDGRTFSFAIPNTFCENKSVSDEVFEFVKCYEIELYKEGELPFFTERILIAFEKNDMRIQNMTNNLFANMQFNNYKNMSEDDKNNYFYNNMYSNNNEYKGSIINNNYIYWRKAQNNNGNKFAIYVSNLFLNKRYFVINWVQYLTKNEKPLSEKSFANFIKENKKVNEFNNILYNFKERQILISKPKFDEYENYTDVSNFNVNNMFHGLFAKLLKSENDNTLNIFKISIVSSTITTEDGFEELNKNKENFKKLELAKYKGINFIEIIKENSIMYICYINFAKNITALLSFETNINNNKNTEYLNEIYRYRQQLIEDNS